jgi:DNA-binding LytR/AlgR family response regulator
LGDEVLHVQADLHYLQVTTALGRTMVLGSLAAVEAHFVDQGLRVHRSHWVALRAVRGVRRKGEGWVVDLDGGSSVPVSRRRVAQVRERLGVDFRRDGG